ncbi:hypothetical protein [Streptomyces boninensis]|uniref:hypothetical protein n=1 Tax=Streptomyces boninensis TaxID=2039455 RepID=UPI003B21EA53
MQPLEGAELPHELPHDLAHTRFRPAHWLATAAALAAVVAGSALLQPDGANAAHAQDGKQLRGPDPATALYPGVRCGEHRPQVLAKGSADLDHDGRPETAAVVRCPAGIGTPPSGAYILGEPATKDAPPRILATLVDPKDGMTVSDFSVRDGEISATILGYSSKDVPRCCPDQQAKLKWDWNNGKFDRHVLPAPGDTASV